jgi:hypothetical protein
MTARFGGAYGRGFSSRGESVVELPSEGRARAQKERIRQMARKNAADAFSATPGAENAKTVEEPLRVGGPRDALIEDGHNENDYVPDVESKGYHVGMVRQPVKVAVDDSGRMVGFQSEHPSKFESQPSLADLKAAHNEIESGDDWNEDVHEAVQVSGERQSATMYDAAAAATGSRGAKGKTVGDELREAADKG